MLAVCARTHSGNVRTVNEDALLTDPALGLVAVADGMGGHNAGELASSLALDSLHAFLRKSAESRDFTWPCGLNFKLTLSGNRLVAAFKVANRHVFRKAEASPDYTGMGTTLVAALVDGGALTFASVGDSRIYRLPRGGTLEQLSKDDSWLAMLQGASGATEASQYRDHPMRNVLTKVVGGREDVDVDPIDLSLNDQDTFLLSTDGLHSAVPAEAIAAILAREADLERAAAMLIDKALELDGSDNVTVVLARYTA